jgi:hypothetical protein
MAPETDLETENLDLASATGLGLVCTKTVILGMASAMVVLVIAPGQAAVSVAILRRSIMRIDLDEMMLGYNSGSGGGCGDSHDGDSHDSYVYGYDWGDGYGDSYGNRCGEGHGDGSGIGISSGDGYGYDIRIDYHAD